MGGCLYQGNKVLKIFYFISNSLFIFITALLLQKVKELKEVSATVGRLVCDGAPSNIGGLAEKRLLSSSGNKWETFPLKLKGEPVNALAN